VRLTETPARRPERAWVEASSRRSLLVRSGVDLTPMQDARLCLASGSLTEFPNKAVLTGGRPQSEPKRHRTNPRIDFDSHAAETAGRCADSDCSKGLNVRRTSFVLNNF
jgi:hypothetical protein